MYETVRVPTYKLILISVQVLYVKADKTKKDFQRENSKVKYIYIYFTEYIVPNKFSQINNIYHTDTYISETFRSYIKHSKMRVL